MAYLSSLPSRSAGILTSGYKGAQGILSVQGTQGVQFQGVQGIFGVKGKDNFGVNFIFK
jgi:hypothetical protein